ncbi:MAG: histidine-type phosphatase [Rikenellaceae bacterium]
MKRLYFFISILFLLLSPFIQAQTTKEEFFSNINHASGIYQTYSYVNTPAAPAPKGYKPFYISHYGRHGSRWLLSDKNYIGPRNILSDAYKANKLTALGKSLYERVKVVAEDAERRYGDLSPLGVREHRDIAERMFRSFPEVFSTKSGRKCYIYSRSTVVPRCIVSMAANNERLKELNPEIEIRREATARNRYLNNSYGVANKDSVSAIYNNFLKSHFNTRHFISLLFTDTIYAKELIDNPNTFVYDIYSIAADLPDIDYLNISMFDIFSEDDLFAIWQYVNLRTYLSCGPSPVNGKVAIDSSKILLRDILDCADNAIKNRNISADLRFGHDSYIIPLLALMDIKGMNVQESDPEKVYQVWSDFKVSPMGANLQLIFYRNDKTGDIIVKLLHCEKEVKIPVATDIAPYYHWKDIKAYYEKKLAGKTGDRS